MDDQELARARHSPTLPSTFRTAQRTQALFYGMDTAENAGNMDPDSVSNKARNRSCGFRRSKHSMSPPTAAWSTPLDTNNATSWCHTLPRASCRLPRPALEPAGVPATIMSKTRRSYVPTNLARPALRPSTSGSTRLVHRQQVPAARPRLDTTPAQYHSPTLTTDTATIRATSLTNDQAVQAFKATLYQPDKAPRIPLPIPSNVGAETSPSSPRSSRSSGSSPLSKSDTPQTTPDPSPLKVWWTDGPSESEDTSPVELEEDPTALRRSPCVPSRQYSEPETPRQRRFLNDGIRSPDRFVTSRANSPTKDAFVLASSTRRRMPFRKSLEDPFSPRCRSARTAEQYATLRGPVAVQRASLVGTRGTSVHNIAANNRRVVSEAAVWMVAGTPVTGGVASTTNGRGGRVTSGTSAPHYTADFLRKPSRAEDEKAHGRRLALALEIDQGARMLDHNISPALRSRCDTTFSSPTRKTRVWRDCTWQQHPSPSTPTKPASGKKQQNIPIIPFRVLDAPALRDDYYCSLLAYSSTLHCLAVGLGPHVYLWSESRDAAKAKIPDSLTAPFAPHVTSISFSSTEGASAILAIGRADGRITLWSPLDSEPRFNSEQPSPVSCVCFRPGTVRRPSVREHIVMVATEELLVGDEVGNVYLYTIEWPDHDASDLWNWHGSMTLLARMSYHNQQVCRIAWSPDGHMFATGGNDNRVFVFETRKILKRPGTITKHVRGESNITTLTRRSDISGTAAVVTGPDAPSQDAILGTQPGQEKHIFSLSAAVKAIAFAPWQPSLLAAGGGSNDRSIHFFHTGSGSALATIDCHAQVTSLIWSVAKREIAATFGFAQPEHAIRVAVFAWPSCACLVKIPWYSEERALCAVRYPSGPSGVGEGKVDAEGRPWAGKRTSQEGCLVVATSDASIKFHEVWTEPSSGMAKRGSYGQSNAALSALAGSQILSGECTFEDGIR